MSKFQPKYLSKAQLDAIYQQELANLEAIHIRASILERRNSLFGQDMWDPGAGEEFIDQIRCEWKTTDPEASDSE